MRVSSSVRACAAFAMLIAASLAHGQAWEALGPGPSNGGQVEGITNREVVGSINAVAAHPTNADIAYVGSTNGGIWRTTNATATPPAWTRLTDALATLSIGDIAFDPTDVTNQTLVAGTARTSSLSRRGGPLIGMLRTTNGGASWSVLDGGGTLVNRAIVGVAARGAVLLAATDNGIYRSTDIGVVFTQVSGGVGTGLPTGSVSELASDPSAAIRFYASVTSGSARGIYRSVDTGATWTKVSDAAIDALLVAGTARTRVAVGAVGQVYVAIAGSNGRLAEVFRSADGATGWTALGVPTTVEENGVLFGAHPGGQAGIHLSLAADPTDANIVYVGGDRQPYFGEGVSGSSNFFPNSLGANDYSGRLFRGDASQPPASRWTSLTHTDTPKTSPHADSRDMAFDAAGNLLETDDGGIYKRLAPRTTTGAWISRNGDVQVTEYHGLSYDTVSDRVTGGAQDTGTTQQRDATRTFDSVSTGDGGHPAIQDRYSTTLSTRYTSFQNLSNLRRRTMNATNVQQSSTFPARTVTGGGPALVTQFYTPIETNDAVTIGDNTNAQRLLIGAGNGIYESLDGAATIAFITPVDPVVRVNQFAGTPIAYGVPGNADFILAGVTENPATSPVNALWLRSSIAGGFARLATMPGAVADVAVDRDLPSRMFALTASTVQFSSNGGANFNPVTGNLVSGLDPGTLRAMAFIPTSGNDALVVGGDRGVFVSRAPNFDTWTRLGTGLPNAGVYELDYDVADNVLVAGTLGRGAWILRNPLGLPDALFSNGFE